MFTVSWLAIRAQNEQKRQVDYAAALLEQLDHADIAEVPVQKLDGYRRWADPLLKQEDAPGSHQKMSGQNCIWRWPCCRWMRARLPNWKDRKSRWIFAGSFLHMS